MGLAQQAKPTCIVLDLTLAAESGVDILNQLQSDPTLVSIPVIIHTSQVLEDPQRQHLAERTVAILSKEQPSRTRAQALLREALLKAGLVFETLEKNHA
jgi:CheY-like chemotaxis protein